MSLIVTLIMITSANVMAFLLLSFKGANFIFDRLHEFVLFMKILVTLRNAEFFYDVIIRFSTVKLTLR